MVETKFAYKLRFRRRPVRTELKIESPTPEIVEEPQPPPQIRFDDIIKSQLDPKSYRGLILENGVKVILISDPTTTKAAACMSIEAGHMSDPVDVPGIAHLTEHVLFLGSEKFPNENEFRSFVSGNGGFTNAQTFADVTKYFFDIVPEKLSEALDRFSQMFIAPLFKESSVLREISAVNSEHEKNLTSDSWRVRMVNKTLANLNHPYSKFSTGSTYTLLDYPKRYGIDVRAELIAFHDQWYRSGNLMNLVVFGKNSLDELEKIVRDYFVEGIVNKNFDPPRWDGMVYMDDQKMTKTYVTPVMDVRSLTLSFQMPDLTQFYKSRPEAYLVSLIGHEGPGSIISVLRSRGWSNSLNCDHIKYGSGFGFFEIKVDLTDDGFENIDAIVKLIFQYLNLIKGLGIKEWIFEEQKNLRDIEFRFEDEKSPVNVARKITSSMRFYSLPEVLSAPVLISEWDPELIESILNFLNPRNMRIVIVDQNFYWKCNDTEVIYGTKYGNELIPQSTIRDWTVCGIDQALKLPQPNIFIPSDFEYLPIENWKQTYPKIIKDTSLIRVWFKQDTEFRKPKAVMTVELKNPTIHCDPLNWNLSHLFVWLLQDHLKQEFYAAELAGMDCRLSVTTCGIRIFIEGFSHKQNLFLETILQEIFRFKANQRKFDNIYDAYLTDIKGYSSDRPQQVAIYHLGVILTDPVWTNEELIGTMKFVTFRRLNTFIKEVLSQITAECFIFGNVDSEKANELSGLIEDRLDRARTSTKTAAILHLIGSTTIRERMLPEGKHHVFQVVDPYYKINCTSHYIQCGIQDDKSNVILDLILQLLREPFFNVLRTQEQQGYLVDCLIRRVNGVQGMKFVVESKKSPALIEERISAFLTSMEEEIAEMSLEKFESSKKALKARKQPPLTLTSQFWRFQTEISNKQYHFNRTNVETSALRDITLSEVIAFFKSHISPQSTTRRSISIHVLAKQKNNDKLASPTCGSVVDNVAEFKTSLELFPRMKVKSLRQFYSKRK